MATQSKESIKNWPLDERPREKLFREGEHRLSNTELLAILLRTGAGGTSAVELARQIVTKFGTFRNMSHTDPRDWRGFKGLGKAKIAQVRAALEIGRRLQAEERPEKARISCVKEAVDFFLPRIRDLKIEVFKVLLLDSNNRCITDVEVAQGTVNFAAPIIREIVSVALQNFTSALICVHNHPSGSVSPSAEDRAFTKELASALRVMQISFLDHIVIGDNEYYSFADEGEL